MDRIDIYSDLDFFAIVEEGYKQAYIDSLEWLGDVHPIAYQFRNTVDGYKLLFADGIFSMTPRNVPGCAASDEGCLVKPRTCSS